MRILVGFSVGIPCCAATAADLRRLRLLTATARLIGPRHHADDRKFSPDAAISRSRMWAASSGVPMKTIFRGGDAFRSGPRAASPFRRCRL